MLDAPGFLAAFPIAANASSGSDLNISRVTDRGHERDLAGSAGIDGAAQVLGNGGIVLHPDAVNPLQVESMGRGASRDGEHGAPFADVTTTNVFTEINSAAPWRGGSGEGSGVGSPDWKITDQQITSLAPAVVPDSLNLLGAVGLTFLTFLAFVVARRKQLLGAI